MYKLLQYIIDFVFPPNQEELTLRSLPVDWFVNNIQKISKTEFPFIKALFPYSDPLIKELIWQIKYKKNKHATKCAAYSIYFELNNEDEKITLIPIPISKKRRKERGYNLCELIIDEIIKLDNDSGEAGKFHKDYDLLIRIKDIEKQTLKNREERLVNTANIFKANSAKKLGQTRKLDQKIIIIDDVTTTGSTLKEAREELLRAGYMNVSALTIAH